MLGLDEKGLRAVIRLKNNADFQVFMEAVAKTANVLMINSIQESEVRCRWAQGRAAELLDIIRMIGGTEAELKKIIETQKSGG